MDTFCGLVCVIGIGIVIFYIVASISDANKKSREEREAKERARQQRISNHKSNIESQKNSFNNTITGFFKGQPVGYNTSYSYDSVYSSLLQIIDNVRNENTALKNDSASADESLVNHLVARADQFKQFGKAVQATTFKTMVIPNDYGKIDKTYWNEVRGMNAQDVDTTMSAYSRWLNGAETDKFKAINPESIHAYAWFYATEKPYSASKFKTAIDAFFYIYKGTFADLTVAEFYAIKQMGGDDVLRDRVREMLKNCKYTSEELTMIASGLMWMNAYQEESMVLQYMLSNGMQMTPKTQDRLHSLSNGGGKAPSGFEVTSNESKMYFDVSSLAWKDEEYTGLFENLAFQDKTLSYSLAVRDEDKELFITQGIKVPDMNLILRKIKDVFSEEYGDSANAELKHCIALSGSGEEAMDGILAESQECAQMGILVHVARIGKKLNIKFYTLFMPSGSNLMEQKQQALSLYKKLSPSVTMWESSMKDTILMGIQQLLNATPNINGSDIKESNETSDDLIF